MVNSVNSLNSTTNSQRKTNKALVVGTALAGAIIGGAHGIKFPPKDIAEDLASLSSDGWLRDLKDCFDLQKAQEHMFDDSIPDEAYTKIQEIHNAIDDAILKSRRFIEMKETKTKSRTYANLLKDFQDAQISMIQVFSTFSETLQHQFSKMGLFKPDGYKYVLRSRKDYYNYVTHANEMQILKKTGAGLILGTAVGFIVDRFLKLKQKNDADLKNK